jgi:hypothetical protein
MSWASCEQILNGGRQSKLWQYVHSLGEARALYKRQSNHPSSTGFIADISRFDPAIEGHILGSNWSRLTRSCIEEYSQRKLATPPPRALPTDRFCQPVSPSFT